MRRTLTIIVVFALILSTVLFAPVSYGGTINKDTDWFDYKEPKSVYEISTESELIGLCSLVNEEQTDIWKPSRIESFEGVIIRLTDDIVLTQSWIPIGIDDSTCFRGTFDGNGHSITGLNIISSYGDSGLFGYLAGKVENLTIKGKITSFDSNCGSIAGTLSEPGNISSCSSEVDIKGRDKCGGIVGNNEGGSIINCSNSGNIYGTFKVGGIVGENWDGLISECINTGKIKSTNRGVATYGTGGIAGRSVSHEAEIKYCENKGIIHSNTEATGGIAGYVNGIGSTISRCNNSGNITIDIKTSDKDMVSACVGGIAGIVGTNGVIINNCNNIGIISNPDITGGIIGRYKNVSEHIDQARYIRNNYYIHRAFSSGIGFIDNDKDPYADKAAVGVSSVKMNNLRSPDNSFYGQILIDIFSPKAKIINASKQYEEAKNKIIEIIEKESDSYDQQ